MTGTSRITGFLRELAFAYVFGATAGLDAFLIAFKIPNFLRRLFAEGAFSQAFIPVLSEYRQTRSQEEVQIFINRIAGAITTVLFCVTVIAVLITPWLVWLFAPGFVHDPTRFELATTMLRITFPYILFISLSAFISGILNSYGKFSIPAFTPNLLNFALIGAALYLAPYFHPPVKALAWGIFIGGVAQLLFQLPFLKRINMLPRPQLLWRDEGVKKVLKLMLPAMFGVSVVQISLFIDTLFASFLKVGSLSWLYFSDRVTSLPLGMFGVAIATVILPHLARKNASNSQKDFSNSLDWAIRFSLIIAIPATIGIILLSGPILTTLLQYGKFQASDVMMAQRSLVGFAVGIPAFMLVKIFASGFYAKQNIRTPVRIAMIAVSATIILDAALIGPLAHAGLALATSISTTINALLLFLLLRNKKIYTPSSGWIKFIGQLLLGGVVMFGIVWFCNTDLAIWFKWTWFNRALHLSLLLGAAILGYLGCLFACGMRVKHFLLPED